VDVFALAVFVVSLTRYALNTNLMALMAPAGRPGN
jgi:hypothetical protein